MRFIQKIEGVKSAALKLNKNRSTRMAAWVELQVEDAISKRFWLDEEWRVSLRQYEAIADTKDRARPYSEQVIIEIPLGAKQVDTIVAAMEDLIFSASPVFTVRGSPGYDEHAFAFQLLTDKLLVDQFVNFRAAEREVITDTVMLGTGFGCAVTSEEVSKRAGFKLIDRGPRCYSIPPEDFIVPGGAYMDVQSMNCVGYRVYYTQAELNEAAAQNGWDVSMFKPAGNVSWVRQRREHVAKTDESTDNVGRLYELFHLYVNYDYDEDGFAEDLYCVFDRTGKAIGYVSYAPYDSRPFTITRYQIRPHIFYGLGVMKMANPFETEVTEWHNFKMANAHLANCRFWAYRLGAVGMGESLHIGPNKSHGFSDPEHDLIAKEMADIYPSAQQNEAASIALSDQRVGVNELGGGPIQAGKRVPAATAMSIMQQQNRRFASPFNNVRDGAADLIHQCLMRMREQYNKGGKLRRDVVEYVSKAVGPKLAPRIFEIFQSSNNAELRDYITIEVTASSASINREADRQAALMLVSMLGQYYDKVLQMAQLFFNPQIPPEMKQLTLEIAKAQAKAVERLLRTFDTVRDPYQFIPESIQKLQEKPNGQSDQEVGAGGTLEGIPSNTPRATGGASEPDASGSLGSSGRYSIGPAVPTEDQLTGATPAL